MSETNYKSDQDESSVEMPECEHDWILQEAGNEIEYICAECGAREYATSPLSGGVAGGYVERHEVIFRVTGSDCEQAAHVRHIPRKGDFIFIDLFQDTEQSWNYWEVTEVSWHLNKDGSQVAPPWVHVRST